MVVSLVCIPVMLLVKPLLLRKYHKEHGHHHRMEQEEEPAPGPADSGHEHEHGEEVISISPHTSCPTII
jgi:hypothetical protein